MTKACKRSDLNIKSKLIEIFRQKILYKKKNNRIFFKLSIFASFTEWLPMKTKLLITNKIHIFT